MKRIVEIKFNQIFGEEKAGTKNLLLYI